MYKKYFIAETLTPRPVLLFVPRCGKINMCVHGPFLVSEAQQRQGPRNASVILASQATFASFGFAG